MNYLHKKITNIGHRLQVTTQPLYKLIIKSLLTQA